MPGEERDVEEREHEQNQEREEAGGRQEQALEILELIESHGRMMVLDEIVGEAAELSMGRGEVEEMLELLKREGLVYEPRSGTYGTV